MEMVGLVRNVGGRYEATIAVPRALEAARASEPPGPAATEGQLEPSAGR
jgi:hypothetical protein